MLRLCDIGSLTTTEHGRSADSEIHCRYYDGVSTAVWCRGADSTHECTDILRAKPRSRACPVNGSLATAQFLNLYEKVVIVNKN